MMTLAEAASRAESVAPDFLSQADAVPIYGDAGRVVVAYLREAPEGVLLDLFVAVVERDTGLASVRPFVDVIDILDGMRDLTA